VCWRVSPCYPYRIPIGSACVFIGIPCEVYILEFIQPLPHIYQNDCRCNVAVNWKWSSFFFLSCSAAFLHDVFRIGFNSSWIALSNLRDDDSQRPRRYSGGLPMVSCYSIGNSIYCKVVQRIPSIAGLQGTMASTVDRPLVCESGVWY
jgi:hypothetical protein